MKRLSQSGSSNFCPELRKNALLISQSHFSNFALHVINAKIQTCIKLIGNHAKKSCLYQIFQNFESLYNIHHILTQVIQTSFLVTHLCAQAVFKVPVIATHFLLTKRYNSK